jgi:hypothetical protein
MTPIDVSEPRQYPGFNVARAVAYESADLEVWWACACGALPFESAHWQAKQ